ncbi:MAG: bacteriohemerythrin [Rhodocyclaceae bacterium]|nr:bacteriohemerythrin [Rhodocyclaceae bacterium]
MDEKHIEWSPRFELGIPEVDLQHHYFADLINRLLEELGTADTRYQKRLIRELDAYARFHFISEENLMFRAGYPQLDEHARHHFALIDELNVRETRFAHGQIAATDITDFLIAWFLHHTAREDRSFADFLQAGGDDPVA